MTNRSERQPGEQDADRKPSAISKFDVLLFVVKKVIDFRIDQITHQWAAVSSATVMQYSLDQLELARTYTEGGGLTNAHIDRAIAAIKNKGETAWDSSTQLTELRDYLESQLKQASLE